MCLNSTLVRSYQKEKPLTIKIPIRFVTFLKGFAETRISADFCGFLIDNCKGNRISIKVAKLFRNHSYINDV